MKKTVVQILRAPAGGIRKHVVDILENIDRNSFKLILISNLQESDRDLGYLKEKIDVELFHLPIEDRPSLKDLSIILKIYFFLKKRDVHILHGHGAKGGLYARLLKYPLHAKALYTPHGGSLHRAYGTIKNKLYSFIEFCLVPLTDVFLFESQYSANEFSKNVCDAGKKTVVNYNGVDIPRECAKTIYKTGEKLRLASFGLLRHLKGHDIAIKACALLHLQNIPFEYSIYGTGEEKDSLTLLIGKLNLQDHVFIKDYSASVANEMLQYDFIWHPSRFESFGYVPVEAMSVRVPVIASAEGGLKEVVDKECGYISRENTPESYFLILKKIYEGAPSLPLKIDIAFNKVKEKFSKDKMLKKIEEIYS